MCTVTWFHDQAGSYELLCNRDEKLTRGPALGPWTQERDGVRFVAPMDADARGTWIGVNELGVAVALLNGGPGSGAARTSRGLLVTELLSAASQAEACERVRRGDLERFAPFTLVIFEPARRPVAVAWNGAALAAAGEPDVPLVSSSFDPEGVRRAREHEFARIRGAAPEGAGGSAVLTAFHGSHGAGPSAYSPCMHRVDARTVSFTHVRVGASRATMLYSPGAPCQGLAMERTTLKCRTWF
jgi:hypothetical protein